MRSSPLKRGKPLERRIPLKRTTPRRGAAEVAFAEHFRSVVFHRAEGRSQLTGACEWPLDAHHTIPKQRLKRIAPDQVWEPDCGMLLTRTEHNRHHNRGTVIRYEQLPAYVTRWAEANGLTYELEKEHPRRDV